MITAIFVLGVLFVLILLWMVAFGIMSYQETSNPKYVNLTGWLACGVSFILTVMTILGIIAINRTPDVKHVDSATECVVEETVEVVDSCSTEVEMVDAPVFVEPIEKVETHHASEVASVPVGY